MTTDNTEAPEVQPARDNRMAAVELLEEAMQLNTKIGCGCPESAAYCSGECDESEVWLLMHRARKLIHPRNDAQELQGDKGVPKVRHEIEDEGEWYEPESSVNESPNLASVSTETLRAAQGDGVAGLLPCPFCGGEAAWAEGEQKEKFGNEQAYCPNCYASSAPDLGKEAAAAWWNRRTQPTSAVSGNSDDPPASSLQHEFIYNQDPFRESPCAVKGCVEGPYADVHKVVSESSSSSATSEESLRAALVEELESTANLFASPHGWIIDAIMRVLARHAPVIAPSATSPDTTGEIPERIWIVPPEYKSHKLHFWYDKPPAVGHKDFNKLVEFARVHPRSEGGEGELDAIRERQQKRKLTLQGKGDAYVTTLPAMRDIDILLSVIDARTPSQVESEAARQSPTTPLLQKIVEICDAGSAEEFADSSERFAAIRSLITPPPPQSKQE